MPRFVFRAILALAFSAPLLAGPASAQPAQRPARPDVSARIAAVSAGLALTPDQQSRLDGVAARYRGQSDGAALWAAAAEIQGVLTPAQTDALQPRRDGARPPRRDGAGPRGRQGASRQGAARRSGRAGRADAAPADPARAEARQAARAVRAEFAPRAQALRESLRAGRVTDAAFAEQSRALRAEIQARLDATRTPEQRQRAQEMRTRREAAKAARARALGLTPQQEAAFAALAAERVRTAPERPDRSAARPDAATRRQQMETRRAAREALRTRAEAILTPQQKATVAVHAALARAGRSAGERGHGHHGARRGAGGSRFGPLNDR